MDVATYLNNDAHGQDTIYVDEKNGIYAVMDGVSSANGDIASQYMSCRLAKAQSLEETIQLIRVADSQLSIKGIQDGIKNGYLTTIIGYAEGVVFSAGDSPAYVIKDELISSATPLDAWPYPNNNIITQAVGMLKNIHTKEVDFDYLLLMSDGISDNLPKTLLGNSCKGTAEETRDKIVELLLQYKAENHNMFFDAFKNDDQSLIVIRS